MVPRTVQSKKTDVPGYNKHRRRANKRKYTDSGNDQLQQLACLPRRDNDTVHAVLTDTVNQSCLVMAQSIYNTLAVQRSVVETIQRQPHLPYVYVGPITYGNQVPVYQRIRQQIPSTISMDHNLYTGLTWNPAVSRQEGNPMYANNNDSKLYI